MCKRPSYRVPLTPKSNFPLNPFFCSYKTPFFALYQLLGAGIFHKKVILFYFIMTNIPALFFNFKLMPEIIKINKICFVLSCSYYQVRESIALVADTNNPYKPIILVNFTRIAQPREFGVKFVTKKGTERET